MPKDKNQAVGNLPLNTFSEIPTPSANAQRITALQKQGGRVTGYQLSDGRILDKAQAIAEAKSGGIRSVGIAKRGGGEYLKSIPDGTDRNNLSNLPTVQ